ncbi:unnamed protein product, partial [Iphiclides podalirius]
MSSEGGLTRSLSDTWQKPLRAQQHPRRGYFAHLLLRGETTRGVEVTGYKLAQIGVIRAGARGYSRQWEDPSKIY